MKKFLALIAICLCFCLFLVACGGNKIQEMTT